MSLSNGELVSVAATVLEDHADLFRIVARLRRLCALLRGGSPPAAGAVVALLEDFEDHLIPHFAAEQAEEFFGSLVTDQPRLLGQVDRLQAEHREMASGLATLQVFAEGAPRGPELALRLEHLLDQFEAHEHAENALMQEFVLLDEGEGG
jgi:hypothetical protein